MHLTRRYWEGVGVAAVLAVLSVLVLRPLLLVGASLVGAWLLARQYAFVRALSRLPETVTVTQSTSRSTVLVGEEVDVTLFARSESTSLAITVTAALPMHATVESGSDPIVSLEGDEEDSIAFETCWPIAGSFAISRPTVTVVDRFGLFTERVRYGSSPTVTVEPRRAINVQLGIGSDRSIGAYGMHQSARIGGGIEATTIREYVLGDAATKIDWNATARLGRTHVRTYEPETEVQFAMLVDHRSTMAIGPRGLTKLDYVRHVALALLSGLRERREPIGLYAIGDDGLTESIVPAALDERYAQIRSCLLGLTVSEDTEKDVNAYNSVTPVSASARRRASSLKVGDSRFDETLHHFLGDRRSYIERIAQDPLFEVVQTHVTRLRGTTVTVILTDDTHRAELREAVTLARRGGRRVTVFVTPQCLFESAGLTEFESIYRRYSQFESFRREIDGLGRVSTFEVAPGDRLETLLEMGGRER